MDKRYKVIKDGELILTETPGKYAGIVTTGIFGRLDCKSGMRTKKDSRVFFADFEDAVREGFKPCNHCRPICEEDFEKIKYLVRETSLAGFYRRPRHEISIPALSGSLRC